MEFYKNKLIMIKEKEYKYNEKLMSGIHSINFIKNVIRLDQEPEEVVVLIGLDIKNNVIGFLEVSRGTTSQCQLNSKEIFKRALIMNCDKIILAHNHPSGDPTPSKVDYKSTKIIQEISEIIGIQLLDHIIIGEQLNYSILADKMI